MMILFILIAIGAFLIQLFLPWWSMVVIAALFSFLIGRSFRQTFFAGFFACGIVWVGYALYLGAIDGNLLTQRMASLFSLPATWLLYVISFLLAAITGAFGAWAGFSFKKAIRN